MQLTYPLEVSLPGAVSSQAEQDDTQLVKASQYGDQHAFAFLVQRHQRRVFNLSLRMLRDYDEASEITYEEMADILTMPIGTIKTHLFRARHLLKGRLYNAFFNAV